MNMNIRRLSFDRYHEIENTFHLSSLCAKVLASKGLDDEQIIKLLEEPKLADPLSAIGMKEVISRIQQAKQNGEKVLICGDYDADGICSTAILVDALRIYGVECGFYIPNRLSEGYGLHPHTVQLAYDKGYGLLITVDNGVKAFDALQLAKELNLDVISNMPPR